MAALQKTQTILYEVQQACLQLSLGSPAAVYTSQDETALLMGSLANLAGTLLSDNYDWQDLQDVFPCVGNGITTQFPLPTDFGAFVDNTGWSNAKRQPVVVLNAQQWAMVSSWLSNSFFVNPACRIYQNQLQFMSPPAVGETVSFQYRICNWVYDADAPTTTKSLLTKNGDVPRFDWLMMVLALKLKWLEQKGMDTTAVQSDLNDRYLQLTTKDQTAPILPLSGPASGNMRFLSLYNVPDTGIGS